MTIDQAAVDVMVALMTADDERPSVSPARLWAMGRQVVAMVATGADEDETYRAARQLRDAELVAR